MKPRGLYESLVTQTLFDLLEQLPADLRTIDPLRAADAADRLGLHIGRAVRTAVEDLSDGERVNKGLEIANQLLQHLGAVAPEAADRITASVLRAIAGRRPDGSPEEIPSPLIPLLDTALLTNSPGEPRVGSQVLAEIHSADRIDVVIIDEFHHAAAQSYQALLTRLNPVELLGLTATPERSDALPILDLFDGRIAAELRLWDAIDQQRLAPFSYFGIHDGLDLRQVPWRRGRGYDVEGLTNVLTANDAAARLVAKELTQRVDDVAQMRALGFCVSIDHARFMARVFRDIGITSRAVWGDTPAAERQQALDDLNERRINVLFSVDLFNEGVDLPQVDTLCLLRPTDSPTLFMQQLGRGLRKAPGRALLRRRVRRAIRAAADAARPDRWPSIACR
jgi:hypothetical protein